MEKLLEYFKTGEVPGFYEVRTGETLGAFDGSFGWM